MKKIFLLATLSLTAAISAGCAGKSSSSAIPPQTTAAALTETSDDTLTTAAESPEVTTAAETAPAVVQHDIHPAEGTYVYDEAKVFDQEGLSACNDYAEMLYEMYLINPAIVTVNDLNGTDPYSFAADAYDDLYEGRGSGLLLLINNDTGSDILYTTGSCQSYITDEAEKEAFFWATKDIVNGDYKTAALRLMQLGERCPEYVFNNAGLLTSEQVGELERILSAGKNSVSVLLTTNSTDKSNEEVLESYYKRRCKDGNGYMILIDSKTKTVIVHSQQQLPSGADSALKKANESAAKEDYSTAAKTIAEALLG